MPLFAQLWVSESADFQACEFTPNHTHIHLRHVHCVLTFEVFLKPFLGLARLIGDESCLCKKGLLCVVQRAAEDLLDASAGWHPSIPILF